MRIVNLEDRNGFKRRYWISDDVPEEDIPDIGMDVGVPDIRQLDWDDIARELNNRLHERGLFSMTDVYDQENALLTTIKSVLLPKIKNLYRE